MRELCGMLGIWVPGTSWQQCDSGARGKDFRTPKSRHTQEANRLFGGNICEKLTLHLFQAGKFFSGGCMSNGDIRHLLTQGFTDFFQQSGFNLPDALP